MDGCKVKLVYYMDMKKKVKFVRPAPITWQIWSRFQLILGASMQMAFLYSHIISAKCSACHMELFFCHVKLGFENVTGFQALYSKGAF